jgi:DNA-binding transcriptional MerR regulator
MPNPHGNPSFKSKYSEKTKVTRLPESLAAALSNLLDEGSAITSSDILQALQPLSQEKLSPDPDDDTRTSLSLPVPVGLLTAIKIAAKEQNLHHADWVLNQCRKALNQLPEPSLDEKAIAPLIQKLITPQLEAYEARLAQLEEQLKQFSTPKSKLPDPLTEKDLAARLNKKPATVGRFRRRKPDKFEDYCRQDDPEGYAWRFDSESRKYVCVG